MELFNNHFWGRFCFGYFFYVCYYYKLLNMILYFGFEKIWRRQGMTLGRRKHQVMIRSGCLVLLRSLVSFDGISSSKGSGNQRDFAIPACQKASQPLWDTGKLSAPIPDGFYFINSVWPDLHISNHVLPDWCKSSHMRPPMAALGRMCGFQRPSATRRDYRGLVKLLNF